MDLPDDETGQTVIERLAHPTTKIVSLTITEKGYCLDHKFNLDLTNSDIKHDLARPDERSHRFLRSKYIYLQFNSSWRA